MKKKTGELELFVSIWEERKHVSFLSGKPIFEFDVRCFAHVLPKGRYPEMRLNEKDIVLLLPYEHQLFDQGTDIQREEYAKKNTCDWQVLYDLKEYLLNTIPEGRR